MAELLKLEEPYDREKAGFLCYEAIRNRMKFPDTIRTIRSETPVVFVDGKTKFEETFTAKNLFSVNVRHSSVCIVDQYGNINIQITEK